jgi:hypothetical protein
MDLHPAWVGEDVCHQLGEADLVRQPSLRQMLHAAHLGSCRSVADTIMYFANSS